MLSGPGLKIDLGSGNVEDGENLEKGYLRQDIDSNIKGLDLVCDIRDLGQNVEKESCITIRASHVMEHFPTAEIPGLFKMIYNLLEIEGIFEIIVPNLLWHFELIEYKKDNEAIKHMFGGQKDEWDFHKTGFTPRILKKRLEEAGFTIVTLIPDTSITAFAQKNVNTN